jgi:hypothetical protein
MPVTTVAPELVAQLDIDEVQRVRVEEQHAQISVLAELEVQHLVHLKRDRLTNETDTKRPPNKTKRKK